MKIAKHLVTTVIVTGIICIAINKLAFQDDLKTSINSGLVAGIGATVALACIYIYNRGQLPTK